METKEIVVKHSFYRNEEARVLTAAEITAYQIYLQEKESSAATIQKYLCELTRAAEYFAGKELNKLTLVGWKMMLAETYAAASVNAKIAAMNGFLAYKGWNELTVKPLKIQRPVFAEGERELTREEYERLVRAAGERGNERLSLILQTLGSTGIRISELRFITVDALRAGKAEIDNKGKRRTVFLPGKLCRLLEKYIRRQKRTAGAVFVTRSGKPVDRSNIWREMKKLCERAKVEQKKVFPHNLRHFFARTYYTATKDLSRLADILGHSNVNTTRIYTMESGFVHARQVERLNLVLTT